MSYAGEEGIGSPLTRSAQTIEDQESMRKCQQLFRHERFAKGVVMLSNHPNLRFVLLMEVSLILLTVIIRTWRMTHITHWAGRLTVNFTTTVMFWVLAAVVIPFLILGEAYWSTVMGLVEIANHPTS